MFDSAGLIDFARRGKYIFFPSRAEIFLAFVVSDFTSRAVSIFASRYLTEKRKRKGEEERDGVTQ